ncbi:MAG: polysaccharide deacetylase family protein [Candidatus Heimdallarchaeota archaeon]|nr:polysaccharide deacetylase family protein [Candidatus Heimdallarchaeota archaeon]
MLQKIGYLTIDDAPSADFRRKVTVLVTKAIPAIFFCRGDFLEKRPEAVIDAIKQGFVIGNHSYNHPLFSKITLEECFEQIRKTDQIIEELYQKAEVKRPARLFRFPGGDKGGGTNAEQGWPEKHKEHIQAIQDILRKLGYKQPRFKNLSYQWYHDAGLAKDADVYWTYYTFDYDVAEYRTSGVKHPFGYYDLGSIIARMDENEPEGCRGLNFKDSNDIILLHDYPGIEDIFIPLIDALLAKGIRFELPIFDQ